MPLLLLPLLLMLLLQVHSLQLDITNKAAVTDALVQVSHVQHWRTLHASI
jgi:hypothetical protein